MEVFGSKPLTFLDTEEDFGSDQEDSKTQATTTGADFEIGDFSQDNHHQDQGSSKNVSIYTSLVVF